MTLIARVNKNNCVLFMCYAVELMVYDLYPEIHSFCIKWWWDVYVFVEVLFLHPTVHCLCYLNYVICPHRLLIIMERGH